MNVLNQLSLEMCEQYRLLPAEDKYEIECAPNLGEHSFCFNIIHINNLKNIIQK